jgi:HEAT repeat protein
MPIAQSTVGDLILGHLQSLFSIPFILNFWTIILLVIYVTLFYVGYWLMSDNVKLVKKEVWKWTDWLKCVFFGFFFANGVIIIISMMATFTIAKTMGPNSPDNMSTAFFILIPSFFCFLFVTIYPLIDFLNMASTNENVSMSIIQEKLYYAIFRKVQKPVSYIVAVVLYLGLFIAPPILIMLIFRIPFVYVWVSWQLLFPMFSLSYYGAKGYITGVVHQYNMVPSVGRFQFLLFEPGTRISDEALREPMPRIFAPIMIYFYGWTCFSMITTMGAIIPTYSPPSTMTGITVYITLTFGITGYFSRFWTRKIKVKTIDILFAGFFIAAIGVNVLMNFTLVNSALLDAAYNQWTLTAPILIPELGLAGLNYKKFAPAADIEETVIFIYMCIYIWKRPKTFLNETVYSEVTRARDIYHPIPPFNEARSTEDSQREHAFDILRQIYARIPVKQGFNLNDPFFRDPLFDAICDYHKYVKQIGVEILTNLVHEYPEQITPAIIFELKSPNTDKIIPILEILTDKDNRVLPVIPIDLLRQLIRNPDFQIRRLTATAFHKRFSESNPPNDSELKFLREFVNDPDYQTQAKIIEIIGLNPFSIPPELIMNRLNHPNSLIKSAATSAMAKLDFEKIGEAGLSTLLQMIDNPNPQIICSAMRTIAKIGNFTKNNIPFQKFYDFLFSDNEDIRTATLEIIEKFIEENPSCVDISSILNQFSNQKTAVQITLMQILAKCWQQNARILPLLIEKLKAEESSIYEKASTILVNLGTQYPDLILPKIITEQETESFIKMGRICSTITKIGNIIPKKTLPMMVEYLTNSSEQIKTNASTVIGAMAEKHGDLIPLKPLLTAWLDSKNPKFKKELAKAVSFVASQQKETIKPLMPLITKGISDPDKSIRLTVSKLFIDLAEKAPEIIPFTTAKSLVVDTDPYVRENGLKVLAFTGNRYPKEAIPLLLEALKETEWNIKTAAADAIGKISEKADNPEILGEIKKMLNDKEKWTRSKALEVLAKTMETQPNVLSLQDVLAMLTKEKDEEVLIQLAKVLGVAAAADFQKALPYILKLLVDPRKSIRDGMIAGMVKLSLKIPMNVLVPSLLRYFSDDTEMLLQQSVALIMRRILRYESEDLRRRAVAMLKIRAEVTQDPVLSEVLIELQATLPK